MTRLSRFLFSKGSDFNATRVKAQAFFDYADPRISVFETTDVADDEVWEWGEQYVVPQRQRPVLGRADISDDALTNPGLRLVADMPPPRHYNICGFPPARDAMMSAAQELADVAILIRKPFPPVI